MRFLSRSLFHRAAQPEPISVPSLLGPCTGSARLRRTTCRADILLLRLRLTKVEVVILWSNTSNIKSSFQLLQRQPMTISEKVILHRMVNTDLSSVNAKHDENEMHGKKRLICRLRIPPRSHPVSAEDDTSSQADLDSFSRKQQFSDSNGKRQTSLSMKRKFDSNSYSEMQKHKVKSLDTLEFSCGNSEQATYITGSKKMDNQKNRGHEILDARKRKQCFALLSKLMSHKYGWVFNQPVDPVKLKIPDYFSVIKKPMDLGTIMKKLNSKRYIKTSEFAEDIVLTFSNATQYNPPNNDVHIMAKILSNIFVTSWNVLEAKWIKEVDKLQDNTCKKTSSISSVNPKSATFPDPHDKQWSVLTQFQHKRDANRCDVGIRLPKDVNSEILLGRNHASLEAASNDVSIGALDDGMHAGPGRNYGDENSQCNLSTSSANSSSGETEQLVENHLSPSKALRTAMLKSRFAETILRAEQKKLDLGKKGNMEVNAWEKKRLEEIQEKERLKYEAERKAVEEAVRKKEDRLKKETDMGREACRLMLQQMKKTVDIYERHELRIDLQSVGLPEYVLPGSRCPLERLGLFLKDLDLEEVEDVILSDAAHVDVEDGEIFE